MLHKLILKVQKFQVPPPKRSSTVVKNIFGGHNAVDASGHLDDHMRTAFHARVAIGFVLPSFSHRPARKENL